MDSLALNPAGSSSGIYGMPARQDDNDVLSLVNRLKDREMQDYKNRAQFDDERSLRQEMRMRSLYDLNKPPTPMQMGINQTAENVKINPNDILSPDQQIDFQNRADKPKLDLEKQNLDLKRQDIAQQNKFSQQALDIKSQQEKINQQKADQTNQQKQADLERKIEETNKKIELAQQALQQKSDSAEAHLQAQKDMAAAVEERHKLEMAMKDHQFQITSEQHQKQIDALEERLKQQGNTETTTELDPSGNKKTVTTKKGDAATQVQVIGKDGKTYTIPKDKLDDKDADGTPHWKLAGGGL